MSGLYLDTWVRANRIDSVRARIWPTRLGRQLLSNGSERFWSVAASSGTTMPQRRLCFLLGLAVGLYGGLATNVISDRVQLSRLLNHNLTVADVEALSDLDEL